MNYRRFGRTGWKVSEIGYGMWGLAGWTGSDDAETMASLQRAVELGCNFFDTAWAYGDGKSEQILAKLLRETKNKAGVGGPDKHLYVATKIPPKNRKWPSRRDFTLDDCYPPEYVQEYVEKSLKNLSADTIDLMQFHTWEDRWLNDERLPRAIEDMKKSGKVRAVGVEHESLGAVQRDARGAGGTRRGGAGDLQYFRPEPGRCAVSHLPHERCRRDRARAV